MLFLLFPLAHFAKVKRSHEIGIGIGTIMLNPYNESALLKNHQKWTFNTVFKQNCYSHSMIPTADLGNTESYSLPTFYYLNKMSKRTSFRVSYQYAYERGEANGLFQNEQGKAATFHYLFKQSNLSVGFSYVLCKKKYLDVYVASDFETVVQKSKEDRIVYGGGMCYFYQYIKKNEATLSTQFNFNLNQIVGIRIPVTNRFGLRYEFSGKLVQLEARLQPINRLSLNYSF